MSEEMQLYIGTKEIRATEMTRGDYNDYRGWTIPEDENPNESGYLVEYLDSPNSIHDNHENYISWSPADVFERSYQVSETFQDRLKIEIAEVSGRAHKLDLFLMSETFQKLDSNQAMLLSAQYHAMITYKGILESRLHLIEVGA